MKNAVILGLATLVFAAGCTQMPQQNSTDAAPLAQSSTEAEAIYHELQVQADFWEQGITAFEAGDGVTGLDIADTSRNAMESLVERCARTQGCDMRRVVDSYQVLVTRQWQALDEQVNHMGELEAEQDLLESEPENISYVGDLPEHSEAQPVLLNGKDISASIPLNGPVKAALDDWLTWNRSSLLYSWDNYRTMRNLMIPAYEATDLPEALLFGILATESGGKVHSFSHAGAAGPLQFIRSTGRRYGLYSVDDFDQRLDPLLSAKANAAYITEHLAKFGNDLTKVLAAYNGGENRMARLHRAHPDKSFFESDIYYAFPRETRHYVPKVLAAMLLFSHPERYRLEFPDVNEAHAQLQIERETSLSELTVCMGQNGHPVGWFRALRNLNPAISAAEKIEAGTVLDVPAELPDIYASQCLEGELLAEASEWHSANYPDGEQMIPYRIRRGDTLSSIARRHRCVSVRELAAINDIRPPRYFLRAGQQIRVPAC